jgi:hypothetical protein
MANSLHLSREVKVWVKFGTSYWNVPILDGLSFSQSTNTAEVSVKEMGSTTNESRRGRLMFNDSLSAAEWSFSTYMRPFVRGVGEGGTTDEHHAVEEVLWAMLVGAAHTDYVTNDDKFNAATSLQSTATGATMKFGKSNALTFPDATIYFNFPGNDAGNADDSGIWYELAGATVNECSMDFDIDGIATANWSGMATTLKELDSAPSVGTGEITNAEIISTTSYIRNRLSTLALTNAGTGAMETAYSLTLTGGSITISNNVEYVTPSSLNVVNQPLGHVMGTRTVSGSFTCYLDHGTSKSADLLQDMLSRTGDVKNSFGLTLNVGGTTADTPHVIFAASQAHLELPSHNVEDVVSMEVNFHALGTDIASTDEITVTYKGA